MSKIGQVMSFNDHGRTQMRVYVGGAYPSSWRDCDSAGWIAHDGKGVPDFGECERIEVRMRIGITMENEALRELAMESLWALDIFGTSVADRTHWRPAAAQAEEENLALKATAEAMIDEACGIAAALPSPNPDMREETARERKHRQEQEDRKAIADLNRKAEEDRKRKLPGVGVVAPVGNRVGMWGVWG